MRKILTPWLTGILVPRSIRAVLEGLSQVPWAALEHAYGSASDVPDLIRALRSPDPEVRKNARWHLYGNIFHQGTRYEASAYAAPFLLELLADPTTPDRDELLGLLTLLAIGYDEAWLPNGFPVASYRQRAAGGEQILRAAPAPTGDEDDDSRYEYVESLDEHQQEQMFAHVELAVYDAVRAGVPLFRTLLTDENPGMRVAAAYALAWFSEDVVDTSPALVSAAGDPHPTVAATALVALGLVDTRDEAARRIIEAALADDREVVRWGAAVALARLHGPAAEAWAAHELVAWTGGSSKAHDGIPYLSGDLAGYAGLALGQFGDAQADASFDALLARIPAVSGPEALPVVGEALRRAFPAGRMRDGVSFADLDERQRRLLRTLADSPNTWGWGEYGLFGNFSLMVGGYGLPHDVNAMRTYIDG
jgi:HEAT repeat protein